jgi:sugar phosphate isomerase/epimerase
VEIAGVTGGLSAQELKNLLDDLGLKVAGSHIGLDALQNDLHPIVEFNKAIGNEHIVVPYLGEEHRKDAQGWRETAAAMNAVGARLDEVGLKLLYHNHSFEFQQFDGQAGLDIFFEATDPNLVGSELDTYWVQHGGKDPVEYLNKLSGRVPLVHLKDMANDEKRSFAEVGTGSMDFDAIVKAAESAGAKWFIVEQDVCPGDPLESARASFQNVKERGWA